MRPVRSSTIYLVVNQIGMALLRSVEFEEKSND
jgi:hypothetical protein